MLTRLIIFAFVFSASTCNGQNHAIKVYTETRQEYKYPWAGGMNSCQFGKLDINLDGTKDLVVFDRVGDRIMPFLAVSSGESYNYTYTPEYISNFPVLSHWVIFEDYNLDGKEDIFTYSPGFAGLKVFKNISDNELEFTLEVYPYLKSFQGGGYVNILVTYADYPAITDLDGDGDLDMLTFYGLGSFVEKHRNMSMEKYGHADSLDFTQTEYCWGFFAESEESNALTLDTCLRCGEAGSRHLITPESGVILSEAKDLPAMSEEAGLLGSGALLTADRRLLTADRRPLTADRHTGSTFRILDLNSDELPDLLLGDVDYPNLVALYNGGSTDTARMVSYDWQYPPGNNTVNLFSMPAAFYDDFDFDGVKDLLVSPFDPNPFLPENFRSTWLYHNDGTNSQPQFSLRTKSFLQDMMLDFGAGAYPVFYDIDNDGLEDLIIGNYGYYDTSYYDQFLILHTEHNGKLALLKNTGTATQPAFTLTERDFAGISTLRLKGVMPAFGDLDGDGDADLLIGSESGQLIYFENRANPGELPDFELNPGNYQDIDVGSFSTPQLFDLDKDNLPDLIIGEKGGNLNYYRNTGSIESPDFTLETDSLGKINVTDYNVSLDGYSVPHFYSDNSGQTHLLVGSEQGMVYYYTGIDDNPGGQFILSDTLAGFLGMQEVQQDFGYRSSPALTDLDQDGYPELIAGNFSGGLSYVGKNNQSPVNQISEPESLINNKIKVFPNPAHETINISCLDCADLEHVDIVLFDYLGRPVYRFSGNISSNLILKPEVFSRGIFLLSIVLKDADGSPAAVYSYKIALL